MTSRTTIRGRASKYVEFFRTFKDLTGLNQRQFAVVIGKRPANVSRYLSGKLNPGKRVARSAVDHFAEWSVIPHLEVQAVREKLSTIPAVPGVYILYGSGGEVLYIGKATSLSGEIRQTLRRRIPLGLRFGPKLKKSQPVLRDIVARISAYEVQSPRLRHNLEAFLLRAIPNQTHNSNIGKFI
jgi:transcriptional regulator with XRE-family HTH domain